MKKETDDSGAGGGGKANQNQKRRGGKNQKRPGIFFQKATASKQAKGKYVMEEE